MCTILDASVVGEVFSSERRAAAQKFFVWINTGPGRLVASKKLLTELDKNSKFTKWRGEAIRAGRIKIENEKHVAAKTYALIQMKKSRGAELSYSSNDPHVLALAQVSGARLLYSNDRKLHKDFKRKTLINPPGSIYSTLKIQSYSRNHRQLLTNYKLCRTRQ